MKLDPKAVRHLAPEDWRTLTAVELGSKNHLIVPTPTIEKNARIRGGARGVHKSISNLARLGLIAKVKEAKYDGYRLTYGGLDYLALHAHTQKKAIYSVGSRIAVGKEGDIVMVADETGKQKVLKIHRLGRISFRSVKTNRDYLKNKSGGSWMYLSRLSAMREFAFLTALHQEGFPVPEPIAQSRHTIVMEFVDARPLRDPPHVPDPASLYADIIALLLRLAQHGLIHSDFNEFNILIKEERIPSSKEGEDETVKLTPILIDFPQMVSMDHVNAEMYFDRDVACIKRFFERAFKFEATEPGPFYVDAKKTMSKDGAKRLDAVAGASGFTKKMLKDLEAAITQQAKEDENKTGEAQSDSDGYGSDEGGEYGEYDHNGSESNLGDEEQLEEPGIDTIKPEEEADVAKLSIH